MGEDRHRSPPSAMKLCGLLLLSIVCTAAAAPGETYPSPYEGADADAILQDDAKVESILKCLLSDTDDVCSKEDKQGKDMLPEALATQCAKCTEKQKQGMAKFFAHVSKKFPDMFKQLVAKYDPTGEHLPKFAGGRSLTA
ncbi:allergen Tha p 1-like [Schistocerca cancellata]|uniref:allergen Tha p 1-like n=1 Tax=Schistocerca cancellata TaxID=274614 RepID=UPI0021178809|nr:allergen Tha p 1-like [Schistocerca cancellata]